jgi:hypothetical protein
MAIPTKTTPTRTPGERIFIYIDEKGLATPVWPTEPAMQVISAESNPNTTSDSWRTLGSDEQEADTLQHNVTMQLYPDDLFAEAARVLGVTPPDGGWDGTTKIEFDPTKTVNVKAEYYSKVEDLINTEIWDRVQWSALRRTKDAEGFLTWNLDGRAVDTYDMPGAVATP